PLIYKGFQIALDTGNQMNRQYPMAIFYKLYNLTGSEPGKALSAKIQLTDEKGQVNSFPPIPLQESAISTGPGEVAVALNFPFKDSPREKYKITVETSDGSTSKPVSGQTEIVLP